MPERILVIDDEPQITRVLRAALTAQGFDVRTANDPEEGLLVFRDWLPDLVVTDLMMPGLSGVAVSYTHLDVYKRQLLAWAAPSPSPSGWS